MALSYLKRQINWSEKYKIKIIIWCHLISPLCVALTLAWIVRKCSQHKVSFQDTVCHWEHHRTDRQKNTHTQSKIMQIKYEINKSVLLVFARVSVSAHLPGSSKYIEIGRPVDSANTNRPWRRHNNQLRKLDHSYCTPCTVIVVSTELQWFQMNVLLFF